MTFFVKKYWINGRKILPKDYKLHNSRQTNTAVYKTSTEVL